MFLPMVQIIRNLLLPRQLPTAVVYHDKLHLFWNAQFDCTGDNSPHYIYMMVCHLTK